MRSCLGRANLYIIENATQITPIISYVSSPALELTPLLLKVKVNLNNCLNRQSEIQLKLSQLYTK